jgi:hypothetical protein
MKIIPDFKNIIVTLEKTIETMSSDVLQRYNGIVLHSIRISSNEFDHINTIDTVSDNHLENDEFKIKNVRYQLEQRLKACAATSLDSIMVKNPTRVKFNIVLINSIYLDDFIVNTRTIEEHQDVCNRLFNKMNLAKIKCAIKN